MDITLTVRYLDDLTALGVTIPAPTLAARDIYTEAIRAAARQPSADLKAALEAGEITPQNVVDRVYQAASDLATQQNAHQIVRDLHLTLNRAMRDGLRAEVNRIHAELAKAFEPAAAAVTKAAGHFGPDTTAEDVIGGKPETIKLFNQINAHSQTLEQVKITYRTLLSDVLRALPDEPVSLFITEAFDLNAADELYRGENRWLALAATGYTLRLNSPEDAAKVVADVHEVAARKAAAEREIELTAHRRKYLPFGIPVGPR